MAPRTLSTLSAGMTTERSSWRCTRVVGRGLVDRLEVHVVGVRTRRGAAHLEPQAELVGLGLLGTGFEHDGPGAFGDDEDGVGAVVAHTRSHHRPVARVLLLLPSATYRALRLPRRCTHPRGRGRRGVRRPPDARGGHGRPGPAPRPATDRRGSRRDRRPRRTHAPRRGGRGRRPGRGAWPPTAAAAPRPSAQSPVGRGRDAGQGRDATRASRRAGVPQPDYRVCRAGDDVAAMASAVGLPCVVKPVSLSGSRGVIRADDPAAAATAAARVRRILGDAGDDPDAPLLVERFVAGDEVALEGLLRDGHLEVLAVFDKPDPLDGPYFEETIYVTPSRKPGDDTRDDRRSRRRGCDARSGLREGPVHAELRVEGDEVWVLEVAARSIGGLCSRTLRFGAGVSLEELILRHALGLPIDGPRRETSAAGVMMLPIPDAGVLQRGARAGPALAVPGIAGLEITIHPGRQVRPLPEGDRYLGFLFAAPRPPTTWNRRCARRIDASRWWSRPADGSLAGSCASSWSRPTSSATSRCTSPRPAPRSGGRATRCARSTWASSRGTRRGRAGPTPSPSPCPCTRPCAWRSMPPVPRARSRADVPICLYGLYAPVSRDAHPRHRRRPAARRASTKPRSSRGSTGSHRWTRRPAGPARHDVGQTVVHLGRTALPAPGARPAAAARPLRPPGRRRRGTLVGYVEASHGCAHRCRHCPVPVVYDGRIRIVDVDAVVADVAQLVAAGARHITFGDPDFLNGAHHSLRVVRAVHAALPRPHVRLHHQGRAHPAPRERVGRAGGRRLPVRRVRVRERQRRDPRTARQGPHRAPTRRARSRCCEGTASRSGRRSCRSRRGRPSPTSSTCSSSSPPTTSSTTSTRCSTRSACCCPRARCCSTIPTSRRISDRTTPSCSATRGCAADPAIDALQARLARLVEASLAAGEATETTFWRVRDAVDGRRPRRRPRATTGPAAAHRTVVLLRGTDGGPVHQLRARCTSAPQCRT